MKLTQFAIRNHQFTIILVLLVSVFGLISFFTMPRSEDPMIAPPGTSITVVYPGATPLDMERLVVNPIEEAVNELENIKQIKSTAEEGLAVIHVEFYTGSDPDEKYRQVTEKVNALKGDLPQGLSKILLTKWTITNVCILQLALVSPTMPYNQLVDWAEDLKDRLKRIQQIKSVDILAYPKEEIKVELDLAKLAQHHISVGQVLRALQTANMNIPAGALQAGTFTFPVKGNGYFQSLQDVRQTIVHSANGKILYLKDLARITSGYENVEYLARFDGQRAIFLTVTQKKGTNLYQLRQKVETELQQFTQQLPPDVHLGLAFDQSQSVKKRLNNFWLNLLQGLVLVGLVIFWALNYRAAIIVMTVIPISLLAATGFIDLSGFGLQQMTISGFVIALGMLVDNAIVVTENITRYLRKNNNAKQAVLNATQEISWAIVSSTLTTVLAFFPMLMIGGMTGDFIRSLPLSVIYVLLFSLLVSLTFTPYFCLRYLRVTPQSSAQGRRVSELLNRWANRYYRPFLSKVLARSRSTLLVAFLVFLVSLALFPLVGVSFFPKAEKPIIIINIDTPEGTRLQETDRIARQVEQILRSYNQVLHFATNVGHGNPRIYYNLIPKGQKKNHAQILVRLKAYHPREFSRLIAQMREDFARLPGAKIMVKELEQGPPVEAPIAIRLFHDRLDSLRQLAARAEQVMRSVSGTVNVENPLELQKLNVKLTINKAKAAMLGVPLVEINRTLRMAISGLEVTSFRDEQGEEQDVYLYLPLEDEFRFSDFNRIYVASLTGNLVPLTQLVSIGFETSPLVISHFNLKRNVTVTADVIGDLSVERLTRRIMKRLEETFAGRTVYFEPGGELEKRQESFGSMYQAIGVAVLAILGVLVLQFKSFLQPLIVFAAIPLTIVGSLLALLITGYSFSFSAFIGLTSLVGIVVNNSIILVDYTNQLRARSLSVEQAILEAATTRLIPIVLTVSTTIGGLLPLTLRGGTLWAPLGWTIIGGLLTSTLLTLIVVPVLYKTLSQQIQT